MNYIKIDYQLIWNEIDEQLKLIQNKKEIEEYLISEIIIKPVENKLESVKLMN